MRSGKCQVSFSAFVPRQALFSVYLIIWPPRQPALSSRDYPVSSLAIVRCPLRLLLFHRWWRPRTSLIGFFEETPTYIYSTDIYQVLWIWQSWNWSAQRIYILTDKLKMVGHFKYYKEYSLSLGTNSLTTVGSRIGEGLIAFVLES